MGFYPSIPYSIWKASKIDIPCSFPRSRKAIKALNLRRKEHSPQSRGKGPCVPVCEKFRRLGFYQQIQIRKMEDFLQKVMQLKFVRVCCCPEQELDDGVEDVPYLFVGDACPSDNEKEFFDSEFEAVVTVEPKQAASYSPPQVILQGNSCADKKPGRAVRTKNGKMKDGWAREKRGEKE